MSLTGTAGLGVPVPAKPGLDHTGLMTLRVIVCGAGRSATTRAKGRTDGNAGTAGADDDAAHGDDACGSAAAVVRAGRVTVGDSNRRGATMVRTFGIFVRTLRSIVPAASARLRRGATAASNVRRTRDSRSCTRETMSAMAARASR